MIEIDPNQSFPNEGSLPDHWSTSLTEIQERELEQRWAPSPQYKETTYQAWSQNHPTEAKAWADGEKSAMRQDREATLSDWLLTMDIEKRTGTTSAATFKNPDASAAFGQLQDIGKGYSVAPDRTQPQIDAMVAEARRSASDPSGFIADLNAQLKQFKDSPRWVIVISSLDDLSGSLRWWSDALGKDPMPDAETLAKNAEECLAKFKSRPG